MHSRWQQCLRTYKAPSRPVCRQAELAGRHVTRLTMKERADTRSGQIREAATGTLGYARCRVEGTGRYEKPPQKPRDTRDAGCEVTIPELIDLVGQTPGWLPSTGWGKGIHAPTPVNPVGVTLDGSISSDGETAQPDLPNRRRNPLLMTSS